VTTRAWWLPQSSGDIASWLQAAGVLAAFAWGIYLLISQRRERRQDREDETRREPIRVNGWAELPRRLPDAGWAVKALVANGSSTPIWDVQAEMLDPAGRRVGPLLLRGVLGPSTEWPLIWTMGLPAAAWHGPSSGVVTSPQPLPIPGAVTDPDVRLRLRVRFTDAAGRTWFREAGTLAPAPAPAQEAAPTSAERCYSRALELHEQGAQDPDVRGNLLQTLTEQTTSQLRGPRSPQTLQYADAPRRLAKTTGRMWDMANGFTQQRSGGAFVIAGAIAHLDDRIKVETADGATSEVCVADNMSVAQLTAYVCSVLTAMAGLELQPRVPDEDDD
jgi:hypothetical protein